jgi:hypothetical protein
MGRTKLKPGGRRVLRLDKERITRSLIILSLRGLQYHYEDHKEAGIKQENGNCPDSGHCRILHLAVLEGIPTEPGPDGVPTEFFPVNKPIQEKAGGP